MSNLMHKILIYLHIIHLLKSSTCFEHCLAHLQEVYVVIVYMQPLVSSRCSCLILQVVLYQMAALFLYNFILIFLYWYICFACLEFVHALPEPRPMRNRNATLSPAHISLRHHIFARVALTASWCHHARDVFSSVVTSFLSPSPSFVLAVCPN